MRFLKKTLGAAARALDRAGKVEKAHAHCDVPCGIYDPHQAQVAAHTVLRMDMLIADLVKANDMTPDGRNKMIRCTVVKEQHAEIVKNEVRVIWGDYAKPENATADTHKLVWDIMKAASKAKQGTSIDDAKDLINKVELFAEWFWMSKKVETKRVKSFYPTEYEIVYPKV